MKRILLVISLLFLFFIPPVKAQFDASTKLLNAGLGFGVSGPYNKRIADYDMKFALPMYVSVEQGIKNFSLAPEYASYITIGAFLQYHNQYVYKDVVAQNQSFKYEVHKNYHFIVPALMANFHVTPFLEDADIQFDFSGFDIYGGVRAGAIIQLYRSNFENDPNILDVQEGNIVVRDSFFNLGLGLTAGARYYFTPKLAVHGEVGFGLYTLSTIGLSYRLN